MQINQNELEDYTKRMGKKMDKMIEYMHEIKAKMEEQVASKTRIDQKEYMDNLKKIQAVLGVLHNTPKM